MKGNWNLCRKKEKALSHACEHYQDFDDMLEVIPGDSRWVRFRRWVKTFFLVTGTNYRTFGFLRSHMAIQQEKSRHLRAYYYMIHPFSPFRLYWEIWMFLVLNFALIVHPYHTVWTIKLNSHQKSSLRIVMLFSWIDILLSFFTGICKHDTKEILMHQKTVIWHYVTRMFLVDLISAIPYSSIYSRLPGGLMEMDEYRHPRVATVWRGLSLLAALRLPRLLIYCNNTMQAFNMSFLKTKVIKTIVVSFIVIHTINCFNFFASMVFFETADGHLPRSSWILILLAKNLPVFKQYLVSLLRILGVTFGVCFDYFYDIEEEQYVSIGLILIGQILYYRLIAEVTNITRTQQASSSKYEEMSVQLNQFMCYKNLPPNIKQRVQEYYDFRFYKTYFVEAEIMGSVSEKIKQDIVIHNCRRLVDKVQFFTNLPNDLKLRIVSGMRTGYYLADDTIIDLNGKGDCMYFIKSGTVAVYSSTGKEICHLEDGDNFGEISLLLEEVNRVARVVALECCELLLLGRKQFLNAVEPYPEVFARLKRIAEERLRQTRLMSADDENIVSGV